MSLISSLYSGQTGLDSTSTDLSVIGDNIANSNTIGFKQGRAAFEDLLGQSISGGSQDGIGSRLAAVQRVLSQGSITNTGNATDLALSGNGFFIVQGTSQGQSEQFLTRAGQFTFDKDGTLVNLQGLHVQGYQADNTGILNANLSDLQVGNATALPKATSLITVKANLQSDAVIPAAWNPAQATTTSNFSSTTTVVDSLGKDHQVQTYFRRTGNGTWEYHAMTDGGGLTGGVAGTSTEVASGTLAFDPSGKLTTQTQTANFNPVGATNPQPLTLNFGDATGAGGSGVKGITQFAAPSAVSFISQDGYGSGGISSVSIDPSGRVIGSFTNGQTRVLGEVAVAEVPAPDQLARRGGNLFAVTPNAGSLSAGTAGQGGRGNIVAGALEQSNVDLSGEFVRMIAAQRGFQANSKTVQTADQLLQELMQLKR